MDPFTISTGVTGFLSLALEISKIIAAYINDVKSAPDDAHNLLEEVKSLCHVLNQLVEFLEKDAKDRRNFQPTSALCLVINACRQQIEDLYKKLKKFQVSIDGGAGRVSGFVERLKWPLKKEDYQNTIATLHRFVQTFQFSLQISNCEILSKSASDVVSTLEQNQDKLRTTISVLSDQVQISMDEVINAYNKQFLVLGHVIAAVLASSETQNKILSSVEVLHRKTDAREFEELLRWISPLEPQIRHQDICSKRLENTGNWFLETEQFLKWRDGDGSDGTNIFGCYGIPGAGKTIMSSLVIDHLSSKLSDKNTCIAYVYCDYRDKENQTTANMLGALLKNAMVSLEAVPDAFLESLSQQMKKRKPLELNDAFNALSQILQSFDTVYLCLDALDEATEDHRRRLINSLQQLVTSRNSDSVANRSIPIKLFFTGRPQIEDYINAHPAIKPMGPLSIRLEARTHDIVKFIEHKIMMDTKVKMGEGFKAQIVADITAASQGMFLLPALQIEAVLDKTTMRKRREALKEMPRALYDAFGVTIERIQNQKPEVAQQAMDVLKWVFLAKELLTVEELQHALAVEPQDKDLDWENFIHEELLLECCLGLVIIDESTRTIRLVHKSLQDYLKTQYDEGRLFQEAHYEITRICLTYMSFYGFDSEIQTLKTYKSPVFRLDLGYNYDRFFEKYVLIKYVTIYWSYHAVTAKSQSHAVDEMVLNLLQDKYEKCLVFQALLRFHFDLDSDMECKVHWYGWCREDFQFHMLQRSTGQVLKSDILYVLVLSGLEEALRRFIKSSDVDVNISHWRNQTLLSFAAQWGRTEVLKLLLDLGAEVDPMDDDSSMMPLAHACESGHLEAAKVLLDRGANVNSQHGPLFYPPLECAAEKGHMEIVKLLLDQNNVNVDIKNSLSQTPLIAAVRNAHTDVLKLLLDRGADANLKDSDMRTPYSSHSADGKTPLHYAVKWKSNKDILELLLEYGAVVDSKDKYGETPLFCSIMRQQLAPAEFLLERGADINSKNKGGWTVLMQLIHSRSLSAVDSFKTVKWILAQPNVDINWRAPNGRTALSLAVHYNDHSIEELLRAHGATD